MKSQEKNAILEKIRKVGEKLRKTFDNSLKKELNKEGLTNDQDSLKKVLHETKAINQKYFKSISHSLEQKKFLIEYQKQLTQLAALITYFSKKEYSQEEIRNQLSGQLITKINEVLKDHKSDEFNPNIKDYELLTTTVKEIKVLLEIPEKSDNKEMLSARKEYLNELTIQIYQNVAETAQNMEMTSNLHKKNKKIK